MADSNVLQNGFRWWVSQGYPPTAAAGIMANVHGESGGDPQAVGDGGTSVGLFQHHNDRRDNLIRYAQSRGLSPQDPYTQLAFAKMELEANPRLNNAMKQATSPEGAAMLFQTQFERPKNIDPGRAVTAGRALRWWNAVGARPAAAADAPAGGGLDFGALVQENTGKLDFGGLIAKHGKAPAPVDQSGNLDLSALTPAPGKPSVASAPSTMGNEPTPQGLADAQKNAPIPVPAPSAETPQVSAEQAISSPWQSWKQENPNAGIKDYLMGVVSGELPAVGIAEGAMELGMNKTSANQLARDLKQLYDSAIVVSGQARPKNYMPREAPPDPALISKSPEANAALSANNIGRAEQAVQAQAEMLKPRPIYRDATGKFTSKANAANVKPDRFAMARQEMGMDALTGPEAKGPLQFRGQPPEATTSILGEAKATANMAEAAQAAQKAGGPWYVIHGVDLRPYLAAAGLGAMAHPAAMVAPFVLRRIMQRIRPLLEGEKLKAIDGTK